MATCKKVTQVTLNKFIQYKLYWSKLNGI